VVISNCSRNISGGITTTTRGRRFEKRPLKELKEGKNKQGRKKKERYEKQKAGGEAYKGSVWGRLAFRGTSHKERERGKGLITATEKKGKR